MRKFLFPVSYENIDSKVDKMMTQLLVSCQKQKYTGKILEANSLSGPEEDLFLNALLKQMNARLSSHFNEVHFPDNLQKEALKKTRVIHQSKEFWSKAPTLIRQTPDFFMDVEWSWVVPKKEVSLIARIIHLNASGTGVSAATQFFHPRVERQTQLYQTYYDIAAWSIFVLGFIGLLSCYPWMTRLQHHSDSGGKI